MWLGCLRIRQIQYINHCWEFPIFQGYASDWLEHKKMTAPPSWMFQPRNQTPGPKARAPDCGGHRSKRDPMEPDQKIWEVLWAHFKHVLDIFRGWATAMCSCNCNLSANHCTNPAKCYETKTSSLAFSGILTFRGSAARARRCSCIFCGGPSPNRMSEQSAQSTWLPWLVIYCMDDWHSLLSLQAPAHVNRKFSLCLIQLILQISNGSK